MNEKGPSYPRIETDSNSLHVPVPKLTFGESMRYSAIQKRIEEIRKAEAHAKSGISTISDTKSSILLEDISVQGEKEKIPLMGVLKDPKVQELIRAVTVSFPNIASAEIMALIQRESGGDPKAVSGSGSRGIMQLTTSVFNDMHRLGSLGKNGKVIDKGKGRGIQEYIDNFKKITPQTLDALRGSHSGFVDTIQDIQKLGSKDQSQFSTLTQKLQNEVNRTTNKGDIGPNLLIGAVYLDSIADRSEKMMTNPKESPKLLGIIRDMRKVPLQGINQMLSEKGFGTVSQTEFAQKLENIINDPEKFQKFLTVYNYNGDKKFDRDGSEHRIKYGIVLSLSAVQLGSRNKL